MLTSQIRLTSRYVSDFGETLVVRDNAGVKALTDPCDENVIVVVHPGRRAKLIRFAFSGFSGRDSHVIVVKIGDQIGFAAVGYPEFSVFLRDLPEGLHVDVFPVAEPAAVYAALPRPLPVLCGAVAVQPAYAAVSA